MPIKEYCVPASNLGGLAALLDTLSSHFLRASPDQIDALIDQGQRLVCERLGIDLSELWQADHQIDDALILTHLYRCTDCLVALHQPLVAKPPLASGDGIEQGQELSLHTNAQAFFPWIFLRCRRGESVVISNVDELPLEAARDREMLKREGLCSLIAVPLLTAGRWLGLLIFADSRELRTWSEVEIKSCRVTGEIFAHALARSRMERALRDAELKLDLIADAAQADSCWIDFVSGEMDLGDAARGRIGLTSEDARDFETFLGHLHPEDRGPLRMALEQSCQSRSAVAIEFRVKENGAKWQWLQSRWQTLGTGRRTSSRVMGVLIDVTERKRAEEALQQAEAEVKALRNRLQLESAYPQEDVKLNHRHVDIVGQSRGIRKILQQVEQVAPVSCPVLITGESGTGKELIAQSIHRLSARKQRLMVTVNCAALPAGLIESELFGRERGAFTGALTSQAGRFEMADQSTIFLDEISELPLELQGKLLRVLQEGEYARLGNPRTRRVDVRVIAATNRDLAEEVRKQRFREDLFYRLNVFPLHLPPLRERAEDIPLLVFAFLEELSTRMGKRITKVPRRVMEALERYSWPGNIRELRNVIERGVILSSGDTLRAPLATTPPPIQPATTLAEVERQHILTTLQKTDWHIKGPHGAAKILNLKPGTLYSRMRKLGVPHRRQRDGMST